jgi:hypothetical protein
MSDSLSTEMRVRQDASLFRGPRLGTSPSCSTMTSGYPKRFQCSGRSAKPARRPWPVSIQRLPIGSLVVRECHQQFLVVGRHRPSPGPGGAVSSPLRGPGRPLRLCGPGLSAGPAPDQGQGRAQSGLHQSPLLRLLPQLRELGAPQPADRTVAAPGSETSACSVVVRSWDYGSNVSNA